MPDLAKVQVLGFCTISIHEITHHIDYLTPVRH
jgi:hypothetical protein